MIEFISNMVAHTSNPSTSEVEARDSMQIAGPPGQDSKFKFSLGFIERPISKIFHKFN